MPTPKAPRGLRGACTHTCTPPHTCTCAGSQVGRQLPSLPSPSHTHRSEQPEPSHPTHFQTQLLMVSEHRTHPGHSDFCSYICTLPDPMSLSLPDAAGCSLEAPPSCAKDSQSLSQHRRAPPALARWAGEGKGPSEQGVTPTAFLCKSFRISQQAHASTQQHLKPRRALPDPTAAGAGFSCS